MTIRFATLGPEGTCHHYSLRRYLKFQGLASDDLELRLFDDFLPAMEDLRAGRTDFILQNIAHPTVPELNETHPTEIFVVDTFIDPVRPMGLLTRVEVEEPKTLGLMPATRAYFDTGKFETIIHEKTKQDVAQGLLDGRYDAGFTRLEYHEANPGRFRVSDAVPWVDTAWLVWGRQRRCQGEILGQRCPDVFAAAAEA